MPAYYFKQPNGKYGRFSTVVDDITHYNMTEKELRREFACRYGKYDIVVERFDDYLGGKTVNGCRLRDFDTVIHDITNNNESTETVQELFIQMGVPEEESRKYYFNPEPDEDADDSVWENYDGGLQKRE